MPLNVALNVARTYLSRTQQLAMPPQPVDAGVYYENYHGHRVRDLEGVLALLPAEAQRVWLCGDSTLDNKHWFFSPNRPKAAQMSDPQFTAPALNGYERALRAPARMVQDVSYHLNALAAERRDAAERPVVTINTAVEESTVADRDGGLLEQDAFLRDQLAPDDIVVVSMGGNDVALRPSASTVAFHYN